MTPTQELILTELKRDAGAAAFRASHAEAHDLPDVVGLYADFACRAKAVLLAHATEGAESPEPKQ